MTIASFCDSPAAPARIRQPLNTVDTLAMHRLLRRPNVNHARICILLHQIVTGAARTFWFATADDHAEAVSMAYVFCLENLRKFKPAKSANPAGYFDRMAWRKLNDIQQRMRRIAVREIRFDALSLLRGDVLIASSLKPFDRDRLHSRSAEKYENGGER